MRFSLATLLLTVIVIALVLVTVRQRMQLAVHLERQHKQANQIHELSAKLEELDGYGKIQRRTNDFIATLNLDDVEDLETFRLVQNVMPCAPSPEKTAIHESFQSRFQRLIDIDGERLQVLSLKHRYLGGGGHSGPLPSRYSVNVLFNGIDIVEVLVLGFDVEYVDYNGDGNVDLNVYRQTVFEKEVTHYEITPKGFELVRDDDVAE